MHLALCVMYRVLQRVYSLWQNIVSFIGLFCKRDLHIYASSTLCDVRMFCWMCHVRMFFGAFLQGWQFAESLISAGMAVG